MGELMFNKIKNKRGQQLNVTTIIILILAILVLVIVAVSYAGGWTKLWSKIGGVLHTTSTEDRQMFTQYCMSSLQNNDKFGFCCEFHDVSGVGNTTCKNFGNVMGISTFGDQADKAKSFCDNYQCPGE